MQLLPNTIFCNGSALRVAPPNGSKKLRKHTRQPPRARELRPPRLLLKQRNPSPNGRPRRNTQPPHPDTCRDLSSTIWYRLAQKAPQWPTLNQLRTQKWIGR